MQVRDGFSGVGAVVDHEPEAAGEVEFFCDEAGGEEQVAEDSLVCGGGCLYARNKFFRNDQQVNGRLRLKVVQDDAKVVLVLDIRGDFAIDDALKDRFRHDRGGRN